MIGDIREIDLGNEAAWRQTLWAVGISEKGNCKHRYTRAGLFRSCSLAVGKFPEMDTIRSYKAIDFMEIGRELIRHKQI